MTEIQVTQARRRWRAMFVATVMAFGLTPWVIATTTLNGFDLSGALIPVDAIQRGGPPRDGIPAIDQPHFVPAAQSGLRDDDRVLGFSEGAVARAYPIRILNWHEVVNDRVGARDVVITYCPLCGTGMAFDGAIGAQRTSFGVSGLLYNSDVLLYDRRTSSLWSQILMTAVAGPLKGRKLKPLPLAHTSWADWRARHPRTEVLSTQTGFTRDYGRDPYAGYDKVQRLMFDVQHRDDRFDAKEWVLGVTLGGAAKAYPFSVLAQHVDARGELRDQVGGQFIRVQFDPVHRSARLFDKGGAELPSVTAFWFAWVAFHPGTEVYRRP